MKITSFSNQDTLKSVQILNQLVDCCEKFIRVVDAVNHAIYELAPQTLTASSDTVFLSSLLGKASEIFISRLKEIKNDAATVLAYLERVNTSIPNSNITPQNVDNSGLDILLNHVRSTTPSILKWKSDTEAFLKKVEKEAKVALEEIIPIQNDCWAALREMNIAIDNLKIPRSGAYSKLPENESEL